MAKRIAVISGASYGIGEAIANQCLKEGFKVYGISRTSPNIQHKSFIWLKGDLTISLNITKIVNSISEKTIDILVNNAGTAFEKEALALTDKDFNKMFGLNFLAPIKFTARLFPKLKSTLILNVSSVSDRFAEPSWGLYASSKAALNIYFETIAAENKNLKVINLLPSFVSTPLQHKLNNKKKDFDWKMCMTSDQIAESVQYIIDNINKFETGSRVIIVSNKLIQDADIPEKLWVYNVDSKKVKRLN